MQELKSKHINEINSLQLSLDNKKTEINDNTIIIQNLTKKFNEEKD